MWVESILNVWFSGENSSVQQHRCGKSLPGQRQRQVPPRHDHLPVSDHLPALDQHDGRCQVGVSSHLRFCTFIGSISAPPTLERWSNLHLQRDKEEANTVYLLCPCREGKNQNEKTFGLPAEEVFQAIYRCVFSHWGQWIVCASNSWFFYSNSGLRRRW